MVTIVNTKGWIGHNLSCDLFMEHMNRACKTVLQSQGSNLSKQTIENTGRCIGSVIKIMDHFDSDFEIKTTSTHSMAKDRKDVAKVVQQLQEVDVFMLSSASRRSHPSFSRIPNSLYMTLSQDKFFLWMKNSARTKHTRKT